MHDSHDFTCRLKVFLKSELHLNKEMFSQLKFEVATVKKSLNMETKFKWELWNYLEIPYLTWKVLFGKAFYLMKTMTGFE